MANKSGFQWPPARVLTLIFGAAAMLSVIFWGILGSLISGLIVGGVFLLAFGGFLVLASANASKQKKRRR